MQRSDGGRAEREKWTKKSSFLRRFIGRRRYPPPLYCEGKHMFRPVLLLLCTNVHADATRFPVPDAGVTAAFYKVRDFSTGMHIRISPCRDSILSPPVTFPSIHFPLKLLSSHHPRSPYPDRDRDFNSRFDVAVSRGVREIHTLPLCIPTM